MERAADDLLSFLVLSSQTLNPATERALAAKIGSLPPTAPHELIAVAALAIRSTEVRLAALQLLEAHGSPRVLGLLRAMVADGDSDREVRVAADRAHFMVTARANTAWAKDSRALKAS